MSLRTELIRFIKGFRYAFKGIIHCIKNERNMRFHLCAAFYVLIFMRFYDLSAAETSLVYIVIAAVIAVEAVNTAIEAVVDLVSPEKQKLAGIAKDCAAGAVLAAALGAAAVGVALFWDTEVFCKIGKYFSENILMLVLLILSVILWFAVIFVPNGKGKEKTND